MKSALYVGRVAHRRSAPILHAFEYRHFLLALELSELDQVFTGRWLWSHERANLASFRRSDYLGRSGPLAPAVRAVVARELGREPGGSIYLLTQPRLFGFVFNPVSFYYCESSDGALDAIVAEITNTPWNERHAYVVDARTHSEPHALARFAKRFHVSPFMQMGLEYEWSLSPLGDELEISMRNLRQGRAIFEARMQMQRRALDRAGLAKLLLAFPGFSARALAGIYWQALLLWLKGAPVFDHPKWTSAPADAKP